MKGTVTLVIVTIVGLQAGCANAAKTKLDEGQSLESKGDYDAALSAYEAVLKATEKEADSEPRQLAQKRIPYLNAAISSFKNGRESAKLLARGLQAAADAEEMAQSITDAPKRKRCPPMAKPLPPSLSQFSMKEDANPLTFYGLTAGEGTNATFSCAKFDLPTGRMFVQYEVVEPDPRTVVVAVRRPLPDGRTWEFKIVGHYDEKGSMKLDEPQETRR